MKRIELNGVGYDIPEQLEELTPPQYYRYLEIASLASRGLLKEMDVRLKLVTLFLDLPVCISMLPPKTWKPYLGLLPLADPFILKEDGTVRLDLKTGVNLLPTWQGWNGPEDMLNNVSYDTFCRCMALTRQMDSDTRSDDTLREFGRLLYSDGRGGTPPMLVCLHAYLLFMNVFGIIHSEPLDIDGQQLDLRILFRKDATDHRPDDHTGWAGIGMDIAETGTFGSYQEVKQTPFWDILLYLYKKKFDRMHQKKHKKKL